MGTITAGSFYSYAIRGTINIMWIFFFRYCAGQRFIAAVSHTRWEDKGAETGSRVTTTGLNQDREETAGNSRTEDRDTCIEDEGRVGHAGKKTEICSGAPLMATHAYKKNQESHVGKEIDLRQ